MSATALPLDGRRVCCRDYVRTNYSLKGVVVYYRPLRCLGAIVISMFITVTTPHLSTDALQGTLSVSLIAPQPLLCSAASANTIPLTAVGVETMQAGVLGSNGVTARSQVVVLTSALKAGRVLTNDFDGRID